MDCWKHILREPVHFSKLFIQSKQIQRFSVNSKSPVPILKATHANS